MNIPFSPTHPAKRRPILVGDRPRGETARLDQAATRRPAGAASGLTTAVIHLSLMIALAWGASAQTTPGKPASGRYLLILDTSKAMRPRAAGVQKTLDSLLDSSLRAQLRRGDTIGVWTYNEELHAGHLPLQHWSPESETLVASNVLAFLKAQPLEKKSRPDSFWPELRRLVAESEKLTVLLLTDGGEKMSGTPYDRELNEFFKKHAWAQQRKRMPFVVVFRSYRGEFIGVTLNLPPWPVEFPPFPPEPKPAKAAQAKSPPEKSSPRPTAPPLIVVGKKPESPPAATTAPAAPPAVKLAAPASDSPQASALAATPAPDQRTITSPATVPEASAPPEAAAPSPPPAAAVVEATPPPSPESPPTVAATRSQPTTPAGAAPSAVAPPSGTASGPPATPGRAQTDAAAEQPLPDKAQPAPAALPPAEAPLPAAAPAQVATAVQPESGFKAASFVAVGVMALGLVLAVFWLRQRRARAHPRPSLITRSMDQDKQ